MPRPRRALLAAVPLLFLLAACGGGSATQGDVRNDVTEGLLLREDLALTDAEAAAAGDCVARGLFESGDFSEDERNEITHADDGEDPDPDLVDRVDALVDGCVADATES